MRTILKQINNVIKDMDGKQDFHGIVYTPMEFIL